MIVGVKPEGKTPLGTSRRRLQNNIKSGIFFYFFSYFAWYDGLSVLTLLPDIESGVVDRPKCLNVPSEEVSVLFLVAVCLWTVPLLQ